MSRRCCGDHRRKGCAVVVCSSFVGKDEPVLPCTEEWRLQKGLTRSTSSSGTVRLTQDDHSLIGLDVRRHHKLVLFSVVHFRVVLSHVAHGKWSTTLDIVWML